MGIVQLTQRTGSGNHSSGSRLAETLLSRSLSAEEGCALREVVQRTRRIVDDLCLLRHAGQDELKRTRLAPRAVGEGHLPVANSSRALPMIAQTYSSTPLLPALVLPGDRAQPPTECPTSKRSAASLVLRLSLSFSALPHQHDEATTTRHPSLALLHPRQASQSRSAVSWALLSHASSSLQNVGSGFAVL